MGRPEEWYCTAPLAFVVSDAATIYMILCHYLSTSSIICPAHGHEKAELIASLTDTLAEVHGMKHPKKLLQAIMAREKVGSTFLPMGVAMPHARYGEVEEIKMVLGILPKGIVETFEDQDYPIHVVFLFISPTSEKDFGRHLKLLARIAAIFHDAAVVKQLAQMKDPEAAFAFLQRLERDAEEQQAQMEEDEITTTVL